MMLSMGITGMMIYMEMGEMILFMVKTEMMSLSEKVAMIAWRVVPVRIPTSSTLETEWIRFTIMNMI